MSKIESDFCFVQKEISEQENTQSLKVDTMEKEKEQMTSNDLQNTMKKKEQKID